MVKAPTGHQRTESLSVEPATIDNQEGSTRHVSPVSSEEDSVAPTTTPVPGEGAAQDATPNMRDSTRAATPVAADDEGAARAETLAASYEAEQDSLLTASDNAASPEQPNTAKHTPQKSEENLAAADSQDQSPNLSGRGTPEPITTVDSTVEAANTPAKEGKTPQSQLVSASAAIDNISEHSLSSSDQEDDPALKLPKSGMQNQDGAASPGNDTVHSDSSDDDQDKPKTQNHSSEGNYKLKLAVLPLVVCYSLAKIRDGDYFAAFNTALIAVCALRIYDFVSQGNENIQATNNDKAIEEGSEHSSAGATPYNKTPTTSHLEKLNIDREEANKNADITK